MSKSRTLHRLAVLATATVVGASCTPTTPGGGSTTTTTTSTTTSTTAPLGPVPVSNVTWTHGPAVDQVVDGSGLLQHRARTRTDFDGSYYPVGAILPSSLEWDPMLRDSGRILGGTLADLQTLSVPLMDEVPLTAALEVLTPAEKTELQSESLVSAGVSGTTWSTALGGGTPDTQRTWQDVLTAAANGSAGLQGIYLSELSLEDSPMRRVELGALILRDAKLGDLPLGGSATRAEAFADWCSYLTSCSGLTAESTVAAVHLKGIPMRRVPVENVPMRRVDPDQLADLLSVPMRRVDPTRATGLASIPMRRVDLTNTGLANIPMRRVDLVASTIGAIPMRRVDLARSPLGSIVVGTLASPSAVVTCSPACNTSTLAQAHAAGKLQPGATVSMLTNVFALGNTYTIASLFPYLSAEPGGVDPNIGDFIRGLPNDAEGNGYTVGDLVGGLPADDLPEDGAFDQRATLGDLLEGVLQVEGSVGVSNDTVPADSVAVRLDIVTKFQATRAETVRIELALPEGGRTEVEMAAAQGVVSGGGSAGCPAAETPLASLSAMGQFQVDLKAGCLYTVRSRVAIPVANATAQLVMRLTKVGVTQPWTVNGPTVTIGHGPDRTPPVVGCAASVLPGTPVGQQWRNEFYDCPEAAADPWFTDPPNSLLSVGYLDAADVNEYVALPRSDRTNLYVRRLDGRALRVAVFDPPISGTAGLPRVTVARSVDRPAVPTWFNPPDANDNRVFSVAEGSGWINLAGARRSSASGRVAISADRPGWYLILRTVSDQYPGSAIVAQGKPALTDPYWSQGNTNCVKANGTSDFTPVSKPVSAADMANYPGIGLLFNYGGTWARYGRTRTLALWNEILAWEAAGLGKVYIGTSGSTCTEVGAAATIATVGAALGSSTVILGGYDLVRGLADPTGNGVGRADAEDSLTIGRESTYGPSAARDRSILPAAASDLLATSGATPAGRTEYLVRSDNSAAGATARLVDPFDNLIGYVGGQPTGRLVETPEEIVTQLQAYRASANRTLTNTNALVAGYDFLADSSGKVAARLGNVSQPIVTPIDSTLVSTAGSTPWSASQLRTKLTASPKESLSVINAHFDHQAVLSSSGDANPAAGDVLTTTSLVGTAGTSMAGSMVVTVGCHSGLPVPDYLYPVGSPQALDWPQAMARLGVPVYVASVGYGYGDTDLTAYSERLEELFVQQLAYQETVGDALTMAKRLYVAERPSLSGYDAKVIMSFTMYGIPTWKTPGSHPKSPYTDLPASLSATTASAGTPVAISGTDARVVGRPFTFTSRFEADPAGPSGIKLTTTPGGTYVGGYDGDVYVSPGQATLPAGSVSLSDVAGKVPVGVLIDAASGTVLTGASQALISTPVVGATPTLGGSLTGPKAPRRPWELSRSLTADRLNLVTGRFNVTTGQTTGTYTVFTGLSGRVLYDSTTDLPALPGDTGTRPPDRTPPDATITSATGGAIPSFRLSVADSGGIWLARVIYRTNTGIWTQTTSTPAGAPTSTTLNLTGFLASASGALDGFVQVVDMYGNVAVVNL